MSLDDYEQVHLADMKFTARPNIGPAGAVTMWHITVHAADGEFVWESTAPSDGLTEGLAQVYEYLRDRFARNETANQLEQTFTGEELVRWRLP